jgi:type IV pilus modification protein PilV
MTNQRGFSLVEVLVAIVILTIGLLALAQSSGTVTTMIGRGKQDTRAAAAAQQVLDMLRQRASATPTKCTDLTDGTRTTQGTTAAWFVSGSGDSRDVRVEVSYNTSRRGVRTDTVRAVLGCV